jgi:hypothetical protein
MTKTQVDTPIVFTTDNGDGTSEVVAGAFSPFTLVFSAPGIEPATVQSERNSDNYSVIATIVPNGTLVEVVQ